LGEKLPGVEVKDVVYRYGYWNRTVFVKAKCPRSEAKKICLLLGTQFFENWGFKNSDETLSEPPFYLEGDVMWVGVKPVDEGSGRGALILIMFKPDSEELELKVLR